MGISLNTRDPAMLDLMDQLNGQTRMHGTLDGSLPGGVTPGSVAIYQTQDGFFFHQADSSRNFGDGFKIPTSAQGLTSLTSSITAPSTADLPNSGDFGWHLNTATGAYYFAYNDVGGIVYPDFASVAGTLDFSRLEGALTLDQHGDLSGDSVTKHKFLQISGTITATQHAAQTVGTLHAAVIAAGASGFMTGADKTKLDNYPADCTTTFNDSNAVKRASGVVNATQYNVSNIRVVTSRQQGWAVASGTAARITFATYNAPTISNPPTQAEVQAIANHVEILSQRMKAIIDDLHSSAGHGLIGP